MSETQAAQRLDMFRVEYSLRNDDGSYSDWYPLPVVYYSEQRAAQAMNFYQKPGTLARVVPVSGCAPTAERKIIQTTTCKLCNGTGRLCGKQCAGCWGSGKWVVPAKVRS